ncbi:hypothetical protein M2454_002447 [Aequitasia blattaphilus]|uniref:DUF5590 domain-containing protein n=1 Tax=Aequitasia blattaphilus TaxID=2949332 RepID=A0ABT1EB69_9FIRM|nr:hypothetical protein [Aequitasia blattaphilus]MCP1103075.1 hypothetical protein [Aequitasia blattaphilus]MCR8615715.1 hypothetical protein [Aequitasia blattaphilus]
MNKTNRNIIIIVIVCGFGILTILFCGIYKSFANMEMKSIDQIIEESEEAHKNAQYYDSIDKAMELWNVAEEYEYRIDIKEEIIRFEGENNAILFYTVIKDKNTEELICAKISKKSNEDNQYVYAAEKIIIISGSRKGIRIGTNENLIRKFINTSYLETDFRANPDEQFIWGISRTEKVRDLKIENQKPTEVIIYDYFGEKEYFWYYENLDATGSPQDWDIELEE